MADDQAGRSRAEKFDDGSRRLTPREVLELIPQRKPFRFIDGILELDEQRIVGNYRFREDEPFYEGHFPGRPVTPGVILLEAMCQTGIVAHGIFLAALVQPIEKRRRDSIAVFTDAQQVEFLKPVYPGTRVRVVSEKIFARMGKLRSKIQLFLPDGALAAEAVASGMGVILREP